MVPLDGAPLGSMADRSELKTVPERLEDAMREIGTLLLALTPLDAALTENPGGFLLLFLLLGASLFATAILIERRRRLD